MENFSPKCVTPKKTQYEPSRIAALRDAHGTENFLCAISGCSKSAIRTIIVNCEWNSQVESVEAWEQFLPDDIPSRSIAIVPFCQSCEIEHRKNEEFELKETECILHHDDFDRDVYRYFIHCEEKLVIDEDNPDGSICNVCGFSISQIDYEDEPHVVDDDRTAFTNWGDY